MTLKELLLERVNGPEDDLIGMVFVAGPLGCKFSIALEDESLGSDKFKIGIRHMIHAQSHLFDTAVGSRNYRELIDNCEDLFEWLYGRDLSLDLEPKNIFQALKLKLMMSHRFFYHILS